MRLDLSWKLDRSDKYYDIWKSNADSFRTDQDLNNQQEATFIHWEIVQRAIDNYRQYIELQIPKGQPLSIYPDLDNVNVGNPEATTGVSDVKRQTIMTHWIGTAANLISGSDLTSLDSFGRNLLTNPDALAIADFTARYPIQPRNPGNGGTSAQQLQAWIAGPSDETGEAVVILANYGPDESQGGFGQSLPGVQNVNATLEDLGIAGKDWLWRSIWDGASGRFDEELSFDLDEGESVLLKLTPTY
jgi:alpha-galactosidase